MVMLAIICIFQLKILNSGFFVFVNKHPSDKSIFFLNEIFTCYLSIPAAACPEKQPRQKRLKAQSAARPEKQLKTAQAKNSVLLEYTFTISWRSGLRTAVAVTQLQLHGLVTARRWTRDGVSVGLDPRIVGGEEIVGSVRRCMGDWITSGGGSGGGPAPWIGGEEKMTRFLQQRNRHVAC
jgi:hypothetical protein